MPTLQLSTLINAIYQLPVELERNITGMGVDSRALKAGDLFFAYRGTHLDGREFIDDAITAGAVAVLAESDGVDITFLRNIPVIPIHDLNHHVAEIAARFYGYPATAMRMIGITGTNGKTSCSHFIAAALHHLDITCGVIGTLGSGLYGNVQPGLLTTPDPVTLQATLAKFVEQGASVVAMEVSSHSLEQKRVAGISFEVAIFTNLTRDHLDYHGDMENYGNAKKKLFTEMKPRFRVLNADDAFGETLIQSVQPATNVYAYTAGTKVQYPVATLSASDVTLDMTGIHARIDSPWGQGDLDTKIIGHFNLSNLLGVISALCLLDIPLVKVLKSVSSLESVHGRMQTLGGDNQPLLVVDYAHTPDALEKALKALRAHCTGQLFCIFGCGGDRDKGKRPLMAKIAEQYADVVVVTDDNPRHENSAQIVADIMQGFIDPDHVIIQQDRSKAIKDIIQCALVGDCVLVAGRGGETYQLIGDTKTPFNDVEVVKQFLVHLSPV
jgi:UDP-N-acetylmuramoyl-L-alanyl-D-glutamate--2,6-diaminopimelate ligase